MAFSYVTVEEVAPLVKGGVSGSKIQMLESKLVMLSSQLSGRFPGLRKFYAEELQLVEDGREEFSDLVDLVKAMVTEAARRFIANPEGMSSETIGVFAYSRFDSGDPLKDAFDPSDLAALRAMLEEERNGQVGAIKLATGDNAWPAAPMPRPFTYSNTRSLKDWRR